MNAGVLEKDLLNQIKPFMKSIKPRKAVFDRNYVKLLDGKHVKKGKNKLDLADQVRADIRDFKKTVEGRPAGDDLVRVHGDFHQARARCISPWTRLRTA